MKGFIVSVPSQKKLNTYGVESPCECLPRVGSFLANPGLSKEQHLRRCTMRAFVLQNSFIGIMVQYRRHCVVITFIKEDTFMEIMAQCLRRCVVTTFTMVDNPLKYWHFLLFICSYIGINCIRKCTYQRRRCCAFDSPGLPNDSAGYPGLVYVVCGPTP